MSTLTSSLLIWKREEKNWFKKRNLNQISIKDYISQALSTLALVKNGTFAQKMMQLPHDFWHIFSKNGTFALVKKGTFSLKTKLFIFKKCLKNKKAPQVPKSALNYLSITNFKCISLSEIGLHLFLKPAVWADFSQKSFQKLTGPLVYWPNHAGNVLFEDNFL